MANPEVSGILVTEAMRYVRDKMGEDGIKSATLGTGFANLAAHEMRWFPLPDFVNLLNRFANLRSWEERVPYKVGFQTSIRSPSLRGVFLGARPFMIIGHQAFAARFRGGRFDAIEQPQDSLTIELEGWSTDPAWCSFILGWLAGILELMARSEPIQELQCTKDGAPTCIYTIAFPYGVFRAGIRAPPLRPGDPFPSPFP